MKVCPKCKENKPDDAFSYRSGKRAGQLRSWCKPCSKEATQSWARRNPEKYQQYVQNQRERYHAQSTPETRAAKAQKVREWHEAHPERTRDVQEKSRMKRAYGETRDELQERLAEQDHRCAVCDGPLSWETRHVDHIETDTGPLVRGLLCRGCNAGLGMFRDNPEALRRAANYVEMFSGVPLVERATRR